MKFAIPVSEETLPLCEFIQGGPIPYLPEESYFFVNTDVDPKKNYTMGVAPVRTFRQHPPFVILKVEE